jgi:hypothetical protein
MLVACLWDHWSGQSGPDLWSFAAVTDEPPPGDLGDRPPTLHHRDQGGERVRMGFTCRAVSRPSRGEPERQGSAVLRPSDRRLELAGVWIPRGRLGFERFAWAESATSSAAEFRSTAGIVEFRDLSYKGLRLVPERCDFGAIGRLQAAIIGFFQRRERTNLLLKWLVAAGESGYRWLPATGGGHLSNRPDWQLSEFLYKRTRFSG